jgi:hypothetical protein
LGQFYIYNPLIKFFVTPKSQSMLRSTFLLLLILTTLLGCRDRVAPGTTVKLQVNLLHDGAPLQLNTQRYRNANGEEYTVSDFKMYLSNVKLRNRATGEQYVQPASYHLVERGAGSHVYEIELAQVPANAYQELEFAIGVDPVRNKSTDQVGALDPTNTMAWDWNTGYKFVLLEGRFFPPAGAQRGLVYHIGGDDNYRTVRLRLGEGQAAQLQAQGGSTHTIVLNAEVSAMFARPNAISFAQASTVMFGPVAAQVADNYAQGMFSVRSVQ